MRVQERLVVDDLLEEVSATNAAVCMRRVHTKADDLELALKCSSLCELNNSSGGAVSCVEDRNVSQDYSANAKPFALHTDGLAYERPPQFVLLYCESPGTRQVPTFFLDTARLLARLRRLEPSSFEILQRLDQAFIGRCGTEYRRPMIEINPLDGTEVMNVTFGRAYLRPARHVDGTGCEPHQAETVMAFRKVLCLADEMGLFSHTWSRGDLLVWDNYRFIHGRGDAAGSQGRRLLRAWLSPQTVGGEFPQGPC
jgi:alpha-ketoglutarate-dependent taurine dioxygenase